ncbi:serine hydrolase domain-containing protein [Leifsonia sp. YAF41]|uniref:serine hydrolase domain-containing protein n=1 Tax=Leifsonia sp. YAF41 TaxID=3233086 RepID=UPI003F955D67
MKRSDEVNLDSDYWQQRLDTLIATYQVPGAVFGILRTGADSAGAGDEERCIVAAGQTNIRTGHRVTPDTLFQLGSITKTWTTTLVMQLVSEGVLDLDAPIRDVLPDFTLADESAAATITMRHLLTHSSGIDGDLFTDTGRGDDCVEKYVATLPTAEQIFSPGLTWSYCNTGFVIAGRVVEVLRGMTWDAALAAYILARLELTATTTLPEQTALHSFAVGHVGVGAACDVTDVFLFPRSVGPAGLITASTGDTLTYARSFLPGGTALMPAEQLSEMLRSQVGVSHATTLADEWALGWCLQDWGGVPTINHDGATLGQNSYLRLFPEQGIVLALSTNGGHADSLHRELFTEAAHLFAGATMPPIFAPEAGAATDVAAVAGDGLGDFAGAYEAAGLRIVIEPRPDGAVGEYQTCAFDTSEPEAMSAELTVVSAGRYFGALRPDSPDWIRISFEPTAERQLMHFGLRAYPQVTEQRQGAAE